MYGFLSGFSSPESIFADFFIHISCFLKVVTKQEISNFFSKNGFRRTKTGQKAVHWAQFTYEVTIDVKYCDF